jgi:hypothetical protein
VQTGARLIFSSSNDTLILDSKTTITGTGPILVAGTLYSLNQAIANSSCPIGVLEGGVAYVDNQLVVSKSDFMMLGTMHPNTTGATMNILDYEIFKFVQEAHKKIYFSMVLFFAS